MARLCPRVLPHGLVGGRHAGDLFMLWNQKGTDTGSLLFAGKARSYINSFPIFMTSSIIRSKSSNRLRWFEIATRRQYCPLSVV